MKDEWYLDQIKIVDAFMQEGNGISLEVIDAYHHGVRGWMSVLASRVALNSQKKELNREKQRNALQKLLPPEVAELLMFHTLSAEEIINAVENPDEILENG